MGTKTETGDWITRARAEIDVVDREVVALLNRRTELALELARRKRELGLPLSDPPREREVYARAGAASRGPLSAEAVVRIYRQVIAESRSLQDELHARAAAEATQ